MNVQKLGRRYCSTATGFTGDTADSNRGDRTREMFESYQADGGGEFLG